MITSILRLQIALLDGLDAALMALLDCITACRKKVHTKWHKLMRFS